MVFASSMYLASVASEQPALLCSHTAASIYVVGSGVGWNLASEPVQAGFAVFPTFLVHSPCSPANSVPAANIPATTNAMNLVIVQRETLAYAVSFKDLATR